jgi:hypothetical protein
MRMNPVPSPAAFSTRTRALLLCCAALFTFLTGSFPVLAEVPQYDVEVVIFSNQNSGSDGELWPTTLPDSLGTPGFAAEGQFSELPASSYRLGGVANSLRQSRGYSVLLHTAWRQPAYDSTNAVAYPVDAIVLNGARRLAGQITLVRERYLHLDADLLLMSAAGADGSAVYELNEKRRIKRSATLHYFDHPHFGMIAVVTPYQSPELQQQLEDEEAAAMEEAVDDEESAAEAEPSPADDQLTR